jgi:hypothetical protein
MKHEGWNAERADLLCYVMRSACSCLQAGREPGGRSMASSYEASENARSASWGSLIKTK